MKPDFFKLRAFFFLLFVIYYMLHAQNAKNEGNKTESTENGNARNVKVKGKEMNGLASSEEHRESRHEHSPDLVDIMDYSPAKRKPPIHN